MKCPHCGSEKAYVGFSSIECVNSKCLFFDQKHANSYKKITPAVPTFSNLKPTKASKSDIIKQVKYLMGVKQDLIKTNAHPDAIDTVDMAIDDLVKALPKKAKSKTAKI